MLRPAGNHNSRGGERTACRAATERQRSPAGSRPLTLGRLRVQRALARPPRLLPLRFARPHALAWLLVFALLLPAIPAAAHAALLGTTPTNGTLIQTPTHRGGAALQRAGRGIAGRREGSVPRGSAGRRGRGRPAAGGREVAVPLRGELGHGTYLVSWRVVSLDSHAISGASTFNKLVFKTLQTYADGDVVRWIEERPWG